MSQTPLFDYAALDAETGALVRQRTQEIQSLLRRSAEDIIAIGRKLAEVQARLAHGQFLDWLDAEFGWRRSTAYRFLHVADAFATVETSQIGKFAPSALYLLAAPATPQTARTEALARAAAGEAITYSQALEIVALHQASSLPEDEPLEAETITDVTLWDGQAEVYIDIKQALADEMPPDPPLPAERDAAATPEALVPGIEEWLASTAALVEARAAILAEIAARSTTGLDHLNALLTSGALPTPFRNRDVLAACKIVQASLPGSGQESVVGEQGAEPELNPDACLLTPDACLLTPDPCALTPEAILDWPMNHVYDFGRISIIRGDARRLAALLPPGSVHLIITSPPYNVGIDYHSHDDGLADDEYIALLRESFDECRAVLVDGGRIAVVVPAGVGRNPWRPLASRVAGLLGEAGLTLRGQIIWDKGTCGNRVTWGSFRLPTDPSLRDTTETIVVAHKGSSHLQVPDGCLRRDASGPYSPLMPDADTFMALAQDHWQIAPESASAVGHPAPFPIALAERLIRFYAYPGAQILDPFAGSGTTGLAAARLGCRATLVDIDASYCALAQRRCARELSSR